MSMAEIAYISENLGTISKIVSIRSSGSEYKIHPTQKPVKLYEWVLNNYAKPDDIILDTHVGSASSLIACHNTRHKFVGFELDPEYYTKAKERLDQELAQTTIYDFIGG